MRKNSIKHNIGKSFVMNLPKGKYDMWVVRKSDWRKFKPFPLTVVIDGIAYKTTATVGPKKVKIKV